MFKISSVQLVKSIKIVQIQKTQKSETFLVPDISDKGYWTCISSSNKGVFLGYSEHDNYSWRRAKVLTHMNREYNFSEFFPFFIIHISI
jgi:hypothetical protein